MCVLRPRRQGTRVEFSVELDSEGRPKAVGVTAPGGGAVAAVERAPRAAAAAAAAAKAKLAD